MALGWVHGLTVPLCISSASVNRAALTGIVQNLGGSAHESLFLTSDRGVSVELCATQLFRDSGTSCHHETCTLFWHLSGGRGETGEERKLSYPSPVTLFLLTFHQQDIWPHLSTWGWKMSLSCVSKERTNGSVGVVCCTQSLPESVGCLRTHQIVCETGSRWP